MISAAPPAAPERTTASASIDRPGVWTTNAGPAPTCRQPLVQPDDRCRVSNDASQRGGEAVDEHLHALVERRQPAGRRAHRVVLRAPLARGEERPTQAAVVGLELPHPREAGAQRERMSVPREDSGHHRVDHDGCRFSSDATRSEVVDGLVDVRSPRRERLRDDAGLRGRRQQGTGEERKWRGRHLVQPSLAEDVPAPSRIAARTKTAGETQGLDERQGRGCVVQESVGAPLAGVPVDDLCAEVAAGAPGLLQHDDVDTGLATPDGVCDREPGDSAARDDDSLHDLAPAPASGSRTAGSARCSPTSPASASMKRGCVLSASGR